MPSPKIDDVYAILRGWAQRSSIDTYTALSHAYKARAGDWHEPHGTWDEPLGVLIRWLHTTLCAPALSALVVLKHGGEPGGLFWECAPNAPPRPATDIQRVAVWSKIVSAVHAFAWPPNLP